MLLCITGLNIMIQLWEPTGKMILTQTWIWLEFTVFQAEVSTTSETWAGRALTLRPSKRMTVITQLKTMTIMITPGFTTTMMMAMFKTMRMKMAILSTITLSLTLLIIKLILSTSL